MKVLVLLVASLPAVAQTTPPPPQIPAHSVAGEVTIDIADVKVETAYGTTETKAALSVCITKLYDSIQMQVATPGIATSFELAPILTKVANGNCATVMATGDRKSIQSIYVTYTSTLAIMPPPPPPPQESSAKSRVNQ